MDDPLSNPARRCRDVLPCEPVVAPLPSLRPEDAFRRLAALPHCVFFDSALRHATLGRYSFVAADPFAWLEVPANGSDGLALLGRQLDGLTSITLPDLPPFQGGAAGLLGYELGHSMETLPRPAFDEFGMPGLAVGLYDVVAAFDHATEQAWLISQGLPEVEPAARRRRAAARLEWFRTLLGSTVGGATAAALPAAGKAAAVPSRKPLTGDELAPQFTVPGRPGITSNFCRAGYLRAVERAIDHICAGDVFQVNLAQRLLAPAAGDAAALYLRLRQLNPAPFAGYLDLGDCQIVSASPERFLQVIDGEVETRPIKGTRRRSGNDTADQLTAAALVGSEKDRAENVMIVDLLRNDLSRVCRPESVRVSQLCEIERYEHVLHLVSAVRGWLRGECRPLDLLRAAFPGGSVTGAPKVRAMQIIAALEPTARGAYCGCLAYLGFDGRMDANILIRTITAGRGWWQFPVGGGIVAQSDPQREYDETWEKAEGLLRAVGGEGQA